MPAEASTEEAPALMFDGAAAAVASARRAVLADRYSAYSLEAEWRQLAQLPPIAESWRELAGRALERNVFYEPAFALAAAAAFGADAGAVLVWSGTSPRKLLGFFPARIERRRYAVKLPVLVGWTHPYAPFGVPLVEREAAEPVVAAFLGFVAAEPSLPGLLLLPFLPENGPFAAALAAILRRAQMPSADFNRHRRALLAPSSARPRYVERSVPARKRKELRRAVRRLAEMGALLLTSTTAPAAVATALEDFFSLEAGGWKGRAGTAAVCRDDVGGFVRAAVEALAAEDKVVAVRILLDGRAIAAAIVLRSGDHAWFWKIAHDERFARFSPGVMLTVALTEQLAEDRTIAQSDSCASADHPMIEHVWRERLALCDRLIGLRPRARFRYAKHLQALRSAAITGAKRMRGYLCR